MPRAVDITGRPFGRLRPVERAGHVRWAYAAKSLWRCHCDPALGGCGRYKITTLHALRSGSCRSCGCLRLDHHGGRIGVVGPDGTRHPSIAAGDAALGLGRGAVRRRLDKPDSGWRRAA